MYRIDAEAHGDWKQIGAVISTIDDGSITLPASSSKLTTSRNSTQPMPPVLDPGGHRLHGICSLVIRALGDHCRRQNGADGDDGRSAELNRNLLSRHPHQNNPAAAQGGICLVFRRG